MTISSTINRVSYSGNGVTTAFAFSYRFLADADLVVIEKTDSTGVEVVKTLTTHYTLTGAGSTTGGTVTMLTAPAAGKTIVIYRDPAATQDLDLVENEAIPAEEVEKRLDKAAMWAQRLKDRADRAIGLPESYTATFDPKLPSDLADGAGKCPMLDALGEGFADAADWPDAADIAAAGANATAAATSEANAATSASNAAASAAAALAAVNSLLWNDIRYLTFADSPFTIPSSTSGVLYEVDCTGGAVTLNLPAISAIDLTLPFAIGVRKMDAGVNTITIARNGTDTVDGATSKTISTQATGAVLIPDADQAPDRWTSCDFGTVADASVTKAKLATGAKDLTKQAKTTTYTVLNTDEFVTGDASGGVFTFTLPTAVGIDGRQITFLKIGTDFNAITIDGNGTETIDGALTKKLMTPGESYTIISDGANWKIKDHVWSKGWVAHTQTFAGSTSGTPVEGTATKYAFWQRVSATDIQMRYFVRQTVAGTGTIVGSLLANLPNSWAMDTAKLPTALTGSDVSPNVAACGGWNNAADEAFEMRMVPHSSTQFRFYYNFNTAVTAVFAGSAAYSMSFTTTPIPISGMG